MLGEGVGIAGGSCGQHGQTELCRDGRGNPVLVRNKFQNDRAPSWLERSADLGKQLLTGWHVKVMEEVGDHYQVIVLAVFHIKSAAWNNVVTPGNAGCRGILAGDFEHVRPIHAPYLGVGVVPGES